MPRAPSCRVAGSAPQRVVVPGEHEARWRPRPPGRRCRPRWRRRRGRPRLLGAGWARFAGTPTAVVGATVVLEAVAAPAPAAAMAPRPSVVHHTGPKLRLAARSRSSSRAWASGCLSFGSVAIARSTTGCRSSARLPVAVGSAAAGSRAISLSMAPTEYTSLGGRRSSPANASGLAYAPMPAALGWPGQAANSTSFGAPPPRSGLFGATRCRARCRCGGRTPTPRARHAGHRGAGEG